MIPGEILGGGGSSGDVSESSDAVMDHHHHRSVKEELDRAVPSHSLLDVSASKSKAELAHKGLLSSRQRPSQESLRPPTSSSSAAAASMIKSISHASSTASFQTVGRGASSTRDRFIS